jgi:hypothetical protein
MRWKNVLGMDTLWGKLTFFAQMSKEVEIMIRAGLKS